MHDTALQAANGSDSRPSKSQVKRDMRALLDLGRELIALPATRLQQLPLPEPLREAIMLAQQITSHEGRRRQTHYVGKLMRQADAAALREQLDLWAAGAGAAVQAARRLEVLREQLLASDDGLSALLDRHPGADRQALRSQILAARKEARENTVLPPGREPSRKRYRALYQALKQLDEPDGSQTGNP